MSNITFLNNQAEFGAAFSYQTTYESIYTYSDLTFIYNTTSMLLSTNIKNQIRLNSGGLILKNIIVSQLKTPFLSLNSGTVQIQGINIENLECQANDNSITVCLFDLDASTTADDDLHGISLAVTDLTLSKVKTVAPLIYTNAAKISLTNIKANDVQASTNIMFASFIQSTVLIDRAILSNMTASIDSTFIQSTTNSTVSVSNSVFDNTEQADNPVFSTAVRFITHTNGRISITSTQFTYNSAFFTQSGGVQHFS